MTITKERARALLKEHRLRATAPRLAVLQVLSKADEPLSYTGVLRHLGETDWDPATIYRNLVKLRDVGIAPVVSRAEGVDRYARVAGGGEGHAHAHFFCERCGELSCLPQEVLLTLSSQGRWATAVRQATVELRGICPRCRDTVGTARDPGPGSGVGAGAGGPDGGGASISSARAPSPQASRA